MLSKHRQPAEADGTQLWRKTQYRGIVRTAPSATTFARIKVKGKLIRHPLTTDAITVAKMRLADLEKDERALAEENVRTTKGKMTFGDAANVVRARIASRLQLARAARPQDMGCGASPRIPWTATREDETHRNRVTIRTFLRMSFTKGATGIRAGAESRAALDASLR